jgi:hypothetical protein
MDNLTELPAQPKPMRPGFANELKTRLSKAEQAQPRASLSPRFRLVIAGIGAAAVVATLVFLPAARAVAEDFLNLFRVQRITAIAIDPARIAELRSKGITEADIESLIGDAMVENGQEARQRAEPRLVADANEASQMVGFPVKSLDVAMTGLPAPQVYVQDAQTLHFTGNAARINGLLQLVGVNDVSLPAQLDGAVVTVTKPASVMMRFGDTLSLMQSPSPSVELPDGVNLAQLGEIGLRVAGLSPDEARRVAQSTDWNSTLLVPIPTDAASFREVTLNNGAQALLITTGGTGASSMRSEEGQRQRSILMWAEGGMVYALRGGYSGNVVDVANSMR